MVCPIASSLDRSAPAHDLLPPVRVTIYIYIYLYMIAQSCSSSSSSFSSEYIYDSIVQSSLKAYIRQYLSMSPHHRRYRNYICLNIKKDRCVPCMGACMHVCMADSSSSSYQMDPPRVTGGPCMGSPSEKDLNTALLY